MNKNYSKLIAEVDAEYNKLEKIHSKHMVCRKGCSSCCSSIRVFPIEYFYIQQKLEKFKRLPNNKLNDPDGCAFLNIDGACTIYEFRPLLCRTHGLPLLHMDLEGNDWEVALCELNFKEYAGNFTIDNTYHEDTWNSRLYILNQAFIGTIPEKRLVSDDMIELDDLY